MTTGNDDQNLDVTVPVDHERVARVRDDPARTSDRTTRLRG